MGSCGSLCYPKEAFENPFHPMRTFGALGILWEPFKAFGSPWYLMGAFGSLWEPFGALGIPWDPFGALVMSLSYRQAPVIPPSLPPIAG